MQPAPQKVLTSDWEAIKSLIERNNRFLITTHVQADPDALGSEIALAASLREAGKQTVILNPTAVSNNYSFLDEAGEIQVYDPASRGLSEFSFDVVFILDISRWERLGSLADPIRECGRSIICMDHHPYSGGHADYHVVDTGACATAELVYDLICDLHIPINRQIAAALYTAILADTGSFSFSNTSARSHEIARDLLGHGINARALYEKLYQNHSCRRLVFMGQALSSLQLDCNDRLAWISISHKMLQENGIHPDEVDGFVDLARNCRSVLLSIVFMEVEPGDIKISLRAKGNFNANQLAGKFGGGGHNHASGIRLAGSLNEVEQSVLAEARKAVHACP
jgi:phosphoesterase RecJ-like protein